jgi:hypothetical protein
MNGWSKPFPIGSLYRYDLQRIGFTNQQIDELSDTDMLAIANEMQRAYLHGEFWKHLESAVNFFLSQKEQQSGK